MEEKAQKIAEKEQRRRLKEELKEQEKQAKIEAKEKRKAQSKKTKQPAVGMSSKSTNFLPSGFAESPMQVEEDDDD
ncbi:hypothetical protein G6F68_014200 [Rhizopus microsporus]|nr:hypothetical protein G6F68_014200 [Rhizopus microsporus]